MEACEHLFGMTQSHCVKCQKTKEEIEQEQLMISFREEKTTVEVSHPKDTQLVDWLVVGTTEDGTVVYDTSDDFDMFKQLGLLMVAMEAAKKITEEY